MLDPKAKRLRRLNRFLAAVGIVWVLWLIAGTFVTNDLVSILFQWVVTVVIGWRVFLLLFFEGKGRVEKVTQKIIRTKDEDDFSHNDVFIYLEIRLTDGRLKKIKYGTIAFTMETGVEEGTLMVKQRWNWSWVPLTAKDQTEGPRVEEQA